MSDINSIEAAIKAVNEKYSEYFAEGNAKAVSELYTATPECMLMQPGADIIKGRDGVESSLKEFLKVAKAMVLKTVEVGPLNATDSVYERGESTTTMKDGTVTVGKYVVIWKKVDGTWYLYIDIFNDNK